MQVLNTSNAVFFDIDGTLVREINRDDTTYVKTLNGLSISHPLRDGESTRRILMGANIQLLRDMHARGRFIIVWSAGGYQWAESVVRALGLEQYVHLIIEKPIAYVDDLDASQFMGQRIFLHD